MTLNYILNLHHHDKPIPEWTMAIHWFLSVPINAPPGTEHVPHGDLGQLNQSSDWHFACSWYLTLYMHKFDLLLNQVFTESWTAVLSSLFAINVTSVTSWQTRGDQWRHWEDPWSIISLMALGFVGWIAGQIVNSFLHHPLTPVMSSCCLPLQSVVSVLSALNRTFSRPICFVNGAMGRLLPHWRECALCDVKSPTLIRQIQSGACAEPVAEWTVCVLFNLPVYFPQGVFPHPPQFFCFCLRHQELCLSGTQRDRFHSFCGFVLV